MVPLVFSQASGETWFVNPTNRNHQTTTELRARGEKSQAEQKLKLLSVNSINYESARQESERLVAVTR